jgi:RNA polymerase sigma factor (sigma-70 family)
MAQSDSWTDEQLLAASAASDQEAFATFFDRHLAAVTAFFRRRVGEPELAFDLAAETFAAVVVSVDRFDPERGSGAAWLFGIAHNKLRESLRKGRVEASARRELKLERQVIADEDLERVEELSSIGDANLARVMADLSDDQRDAVLARVVDERAYFEIANTLGCSEMVVRQRVHRGLARLRAGLEDSR